MIIRFSWILSVAAIVVRSLPCDAKQLKSNLKVLSVTFAANTICLLDRHRSVGFADEIKVVRRAGDTVVKTRYKLASP